MKATQRQILLTMAAALLTIGVGPGIQPTAAQGFPDPSISGFLRSLNTQDFFKQGRIAQEQEIERLKDFSELSSKQVIKIAPDASVQEKDIRELEPERQDPKRKR